jgi:adenine-specific DNA-methyltransferase
MPSKYDAIEQSRCALQGELDGHKSQAERNKLGQFATPTALARDVLAYGLALLPEKAPVRFLDPAIGTGSFYSALMSTCRRRPVASAQGFEIDPHYGEPAKALWQGTPLQITLSDFTRQLAPADDRQRANLLICNPPYVRHHHMNGAEKARLQDAARAASHVELSGLAGLYCYFMALAHSWMAEDGVAGWLIPSEFMDVNYGRALKAYLLREVTLLHIHRFDPNDTQFADALVSSAIVWFRKAPAPPDHEVKFSFGGSLTKPQLVRLVTTAALAKEAKWTRFPAAAVRERSTVPTVSDFFQIKRGVATGDNGYFILRAEEIERRGLPFELFRPILPSPRYVAADEITSDEHGLPMLDRRLFLLDPKMPEDMIRKRFPKLYDYLQEGRAKGLHEGYLCSRRTPWYTQEKREPAPIVCTYLGRGDSKNGRPFRFILNNSRATVANVYLSMYPTPALSAALARDPSLIRRVWESLNRITPAQLMGEGRVYGGGLHKLEPRELANVPVGELADILPVGTGAGCQAEMFETFDDNAQARELERVAV